MKDIAVNIGKEFSRYPAGRFPTDGKFNGETFRKKFLVPHIEKGETIEIYLDDAVDFGSSFLEEAFGGLVRTEKIDVDTLRKLITFSTSRHPFVPDEVWMYVSEAGSETLQ